MPVGVPRATTRRGGPRNATARPRFPRRPRLDAPSASAETSQSAPSSASSATASDARDDLPVRVYIEHTDAYQVVYHSNYFKFLWRAREAYVFGGGLASALRDRTGAPFDPTAAGWDHLDVVAIDDCVFARSAVLGDDLLVRTSLRGIGETTLAMRQEVVFADGGELAFAATATVAPASATGATTTIPREIRGWRAGDGDGGDGDDGGDVGTGYEDPAWLARASASVEDAGDAEADVEADADPPSGSTTTKTRVTLFESELSLGRARGASDADVLRWFERDRTEAIGGSGALSALKENDGVAVVVSSMDGFRCRPGNVVGSVGQCRTKNGANGGRNVRPAVASVRSTIEMRRRNIQVAFIQRLFDDAGACVARAEVVCTCVTRDGGKPTRCPAALAEKFKAMRRG